MDQLINAVKWVQENWVNISEAIATIIGAASILIKLFPVLDKNNWFLPVVKFIGKYIALNKTVTESDRPA